MNTEKYNKKTLTDYLLGSLSEEPAEIFDELSVTDSDFVEQLKSAENDLIDSYINDELEKLEFAKFEANYLASPMRRDKVEFARALQLVANTNLLNLSEVKEKHTSRGGFAFWSFFSNLNGSTQLAFATILLAFAGFFGWLFLVRTDNSNDQVKLENTPKPLPTNEPIQIPIPIPIPTPTTVQITPIPAVSPKNTNTEKTRELKLSPTPQPTTEPTKSPTANIPTLATFVLLPPTRNLNSLQTISVPKNTTNLGFRLPLESDDFNSYRVFLKNQAGTILWRSGKLASKQSSISIEFPAKLLQTNIYSFALVGIDEANGTESIGDYSFRSVLK